MEILFQWFGHLDSPTIEEKLREYFVMNTGYNHE